MAAVEEAGSKGDALYSGTAITTVPGNTESLTLGFSSVLDSSVADSGVHGSMSPGRTAVIYPRVVTSKEILEDSDDDSIFCGPPSEPEQSGSSELRSLQAWGIGVQDEEPRRRRRNRDAGADEAGGERGRRAPVPLVQAKGDAIVENQKFICVFQIGLEDDEEFCLVKRILGKAGNNMRRIADDCNAKVCLRGIGSGFLEGADGKEANMPLQLNVSCTDYEEYVTAVDQVATLLKDLYKHYRRYARSKGMEPPDVKISLEEVRRDDLNIDLLSAKANRSPSQRDRDRRAREQERKLHRERERDKVAARAAAATGKATAEGTLSAATITASARARQHSRERLARAVPRSTDAPAESSDSQSDDGDGAVDEELQQRPAMRLPSGQPVPTTPAGRRAAARTGGAAAAAVASAAAREADREERDTQRADRDKKRRETEDRAAAVARRPGRNAPRGLGLLTRGNSEAQAGGPVGGGGGAFLAGATGNSKGSGKGKGGSKGGYPAQAPAAPPPPPPGPPPEDAMRVGGPLGGPAAAKAAPQRR